MTSSTKRETVLKMTNWRSEEVRALFEAVDATSDEKTKAVFQNLWNRVEEVSVAVGQLRQSMDRAETAVANCRAALSGGRSLNSLGEMQSSNLDADVARFEATMTAAVRALDLAEMFGLNL